MIAWSNRRQNQLTKNVSHLRIGSQMEKVAVSLTGKKFGAIGPPGIPSFGGS